MYNVYDKNGLPFWTAEEIKLRATLTDLLAGRVQRALLGENPAWQFVQVEAPLLTPRTLINPNYTDADVFVLDDLVLRPETTPGSYVFARKLFDGGWNKPPLCVWQAGKSFRRESDQPTKFMRLKEFYQQEFQCVFTSDTKADYHTLLAKTAEQAIREFVGKPTRLVPSDRLPDYSLRTMDVEVEVESGRWMELSSISLRKDFPGTFTFQGKGGAVPKELLVAEVAIGLDRCVHALTINWGRPPREDAGE